MTIKVRHDGVLRTITGLKGPLGGTLRVIRSVKVMQGGNLRTVANFVPPLSLSSNADSMYGYALSSFGSMEYVQSNSVTITPSGGLPPYTYAWSVISGYPVSIAGSATATALVFITANVGTYSGTLRCTVNASNGDSAAMDVPFLLSIENNI